MVVDLSRFPSSLRLSVRDGVASGVAGVGAWYVRSIPLPLPFPAADPVSYAAGRERRSFAAGWLAALADGGARFVNPPAKMLQHFRKVEQLASLRSAGVCVPATLATNSPEDVVAFAREVGALVYKPLAGGGRCRRVTASDLSADRLAALARAPVMFQEEVPGRNVRAYVVDGAVVAAYEIESDELDYRGAETSVSVFAVDAPLADVCVRAAAACDMAFTGIDVRLGPEGRAVVLECNPSPMFAAIERRAGTSQVSAALARTLTG